MRRRELLLAGISLPFLTSLSDVLGPQAAVAQDAEGTPFDASTVREMARGLAQKPFKPQEIKLPEGYAEMNYDLYRDIRFSPDKSLWRQDKLPFEVQFFHRGFLFRNRVDIYVVDEGKARHVDYSTDLFTFGKAARPDGGDLGFAGFRLHAPMNKPDYYDEVATFLGATYFRAVAKDQIYGLSARGLSIKTGSSEGEEFPLFTSFWLERPKPGTSSIVVHALLDSESAAAAFRFTIRPGEATVFDVELSLYPRVEITQAGIATLTSMFYFDAVDRNDIDDFRPGVHDSDGLAIWTGRGEQLWRPLSNPTNLQISVLSDVNPRGFGLMQRQRAFFDYNDLEARYEKRPSLWIEPIGDWGEGAVHLLEIPTNSEINDNIVAFWRPREPLRPKGEYRYTYRMHWSWDNPWKTGLATWRVSSSGRSLRSKSRVFVLEAIGDALKDLPPDAKVIGEVTASGGRIENIVTQPNPERGGWRLSFNLFNERDVVELRASLSDGTKSLSETWIYRWTA
ncbi:glucans biosynthesis protein G [Agaricicola taiwanensis]|uniref:Glucans biosynthesis protein G n=1 Tax=Agaricicola taiwanensis TaxID=591372 RepID=A0A8J2YGT1_9RHOB|nr:glucan biosynthesis protein G [Agaricicola taiwanensis]GGE37645.1 glucans biosynthesis protein G [Agaricicola taiwanensis]